MFNRKIYLYNQDLFDENLKQVKKVKSAKVIGTFLPINLFKSYTLKYEGDNSESAILEFIYNKMTQDWGLNENFEYRFSYNISNKINDYYVLNVNLVDEDTLKTNYKTVFDKYEINYIDVETNKYKSLYKNDLIQDNSSHIFFKMDHNTSFFVIYKNGVPLYSKQMISIKDIEHKLMNGINKRFNFTKILLENGLNKNLYNEDTMEIYNLLVSIFDEFIISDIVNIINRNSKMLDYENIDFIYTNDLIKNLDNFIKTKIETSTVISYVNPIKGLNDNQISLNYLKDVNKVNGQNNLTVFKQESNIIGSIFISTSVITFIILFLFSVMEFYKSIDIDDNIKSINVTKNEIELKIKNQTAEQNTIIKDIELENKKLNDYKNNLSLSKIDFENYINNDKNYIMTKIFKLNNNLEKEKIKLSSISINTDNNHANLNMSLILKKNELKKLTNYIKNVWGEYNIQISTLYLKKNKIGEPMFEIYGEEYYEANISIKDL